MRIHERHAYPEEQRAFNAEPVLCAASALCIAAWRDLTTCRAIGFDCIGPIPAWAIWEWCDRGHLDTDIADLVTCVVRRIDNDFLETEASKRANADVKGA